MKSHLLIYMFFSKKKNIIIFCLIFLQLLPYLCQVLLPFLAPFSVSLRMDTHYNTEIIWHYFSCISFDIQYNNTKFLYKYTLCIAHRHFLTGKTYDMSPLSVLSQSCHVLVKF